MLYRIYLFPLLFVICRLSNAQNIITKEYSELPIKPARTISFTTYEGSYMDVQISPDGKTILFDLLGSLFLLPSKGGVAKQITRGLAMNHSPAWSPDGKLIAYSSDASGDRRLHVINADGSNDLFNGKPQWLPDGKSILFGTFLYDLEGNKIAFKDEFRINESIIGYSNGGRFFYTLNDVIARYDKNLLQKTVVKTLKQNCQVTNAKISEDGCWLTYTEVYKDTTKLLAYNMAEGKERVLAITSVEYAPYNYHSQYSISTDSKNVFVGYGGKIHKIELSTGKNEIIPFSAVVKVDLGPLDYNTFNVSYDSLRVSYTRSANANPGGTQLAFSALNRVYIMDLPNGKPRILALQSEGQFCPRFSPDGKWVVYVSWSDTAGGQIWRVPSGGGKPEQLTQEAARYQYVNWSPDGKQIVAVKGVLGYEADDEPDRGEIITINVDKGEERLLADKVPFYNSPVFTDDGLAVIYIDMTKSYNQIIVKKQLYTPNFTVLATVKSTIQYRQIVVSPDGRFIVYTASESLYLIPVSDQNQSLVLDDKNSLCPSIRFSEGGFDPHWEQGGKILSWSYGKKYYQVDPDKIIDMANKLSHDRSNSTANDESSNTIKCKVQPDRTVTINLVAPRNYSKGTIVLKNARVITMRGDDVIERGTIVICNGRILSVRKTDNINIPAGAITVDVTGKTIIPGFIDLHAHYHIHARDVIPQQSWQLLVNLAYGVTTSRDPSAGLDQYGYSELLQDGSLIGPRLYSSGQAIRGGRYDISRFEEAQSVVNNHAVSGGTFMKQYLLPTRMQRQWLLIACTKAGLNMTNEGYQNALEYLGLIKDGSTGVEHSPLWDNVYKDAIKFLSLSGTFLTPTLQVTPHECVKYFRKQYYRNLDSRLLRFTPKNIIEATVNDIKRGDTIPYFINEAKVYAAILHNGGKIGMGSHGEDQGIGAHFEIWALQMGGLTNMEALRCATLTGAEGLGIQKDLGSIEVGKIADLIILDKNPLEDIHNTTSIKYVMKDGILYDGNTLDQIWPENKKCPGRRYIRCTK